mmetsp:Transcript_3919/g.9144  ORF Transcript_3919/g.9144 Transcript_3919/m.9144 type:complete len:238 (+) Transcript_3919:316-1029(+)
MLMRCQDFSKFIFGKFVSLLSSLLQDAIEADNCRCLHQTCCLRGSSSSHCVCGFLWHCHRQTRQAFGAESVRARQSRCACSGLASLVATTIKVWCHQAEPLLLTGTKAGTATRHKKGPLQQATCSWPIRDLLLKEPSVRIDQLFTSTLQFFPGRFRIHHLHGQLQQGSCGEGQVKTTQLKAYAPKGPHVHVKVIPLVPHELRRHVGWGANTRGGKCCTLQHSGYTKVTNADPSPAIA